MDFTSNFPIVPSSLPDPSGWFHPSYLVTGFWIVVAIVMIISMVLVWHWKEYGENYVRGFLVHAIYGFGLLLILSTLLTKVHALAALL